jgi:carboxyl-terminal processing protease
VIPSLLDNLELGESFLSHALLHDRIKPADKFKPLDGQILFLETLKKRSAERVRSSKDFEYVLEDVLKLKSSQQAESISLNLARRIRELNEDEQAEEERNLERAIRFKEITKQDQERFVFSKLSLDSITQGAGFIVYDPSVDDQGYVRRSNDTVPNHDTEPKWPSGLDLTKREALFILKDLVDLTEQSKVADLVK